MQVRAPASENIVTQGGGLHRRPRPNRRRGAAGRHIIVVVIVNVALDGREEQSTMMMCLRLQPFPSRAPPSALPYRFKQCRRQWQDSIGEQEEGHYPKDGRHGHIVCSRACPPPLLAMPRFDSVAAAAAATMTTIKLKATVAAAAAWWQLRPKRGGGSGFSMGAEAASLRRMWGQRSSGGISIKMAAV
jgi:hypothetical protein